MDSYSNDGRRPRNTVVRTIGRGVTGAIFAYGTYRFVNWAWNAYFGGDNDHDKQNENQFEEPRSSMHSVVDRMLSTTIAPSSVPRNQWILRSKRMDRCRAEVLKALEGFLPTLKRKIEGKTKTSKETQALKKLRSERAAAASTTSDADEVRRRKIEKDLWDTVKIQAVTRMVATAYAHTLLYLVLTVQVNLLGGKLFNEQIRMRTNSSSPSMMNIDSVASEDSSDQMDSYQASHRLVLESTYEYFFDQGLISLIKTVERSVSSILQDWNVTDPSSLDISVDLFDKAIEDIRSAEEDISRTITTNSNEANHRGSFKSRRPRTFLRFLVPPSETFESSVSDEVACLIVDETWDILESPVLIDAQQNCLDVTFDCMREHHWGKIFSASPTATVATTTTTRATNSKDYVEERQWERKPLAHIITQLKHTSNSFYSSIKQQNDEGVTTAVKPNKYCQGMETIPTVLELADVSFN